jgi:hypothetical protein
MQKHFVDGYHDKSMKEFERKRKLKLFINMGILIVSATANIIV